MNVIECAQGSAEWYQARIGVLGASRIAAACAKLKRKEGEAAARHDLRFELACERMTGKPSEHYVSQWMEHGMEWEPVARSEYEMRQGVNVSQVGFVYHPTIQWAGCSPDGLVGAGGLIEIKCPKAETHLEYLLEDKVPDQYLPQMLWQLACTGRQWNDFVSYHPDMPDDLQLFVKRLPRNEEAEAVIRGMEAEAEQFLKEVAEMVDKLGGERKRKVEVLAGAELITEEDYREFLQ